MAYEQFTVGMHNLAKQQEHDGFKVEMQRIKEFPYPIISSQKIK